MMNSSNFTDQARTVLELARVSASTRHHDHVDPEHILLGLMVERDGAGAAVLRQIGIDLRDMQTRVEGKLKPSRSGRPTGPDLPYTARAKRVLEFAMRESRDLNHAHVGSEHLVIAVMREKGMAARALAEAGASLDGLRKETSRLLGTDP
jgi:ATP-dependent Clp protease ATP-binding subunit ClpC